MKTVICTALGLVLAAGSGYPQDMGGSPKPESQAGPKEELDKAAAKAGAMTNYSCTITLRLEGMGEGEGSQPVELLIQPDSPWQLKAGDLEAFKKGETLAVKEGGAWKKLGRGSKPAQALGMVRGPHEVVKDLTSESFKEVKREDSEGGRCFTGELTLVAIRQLARGDRSLPKPTGTAKVWVNGEGAVTKYEIHIESKTKSADGQEVAVKRTITAEIRDIGSTKYEVPPEAAKALEG